MDRRLIEQLAELAESFNRIGLKPVICGGLGLYLCFHKAQGQTRQMIRATIDIDLMLTPTQILEQAERWAIAETITDGLGYIVREGCEYYQFIKEPDQALDILSPPVEGLEVDNFRVKIVKAKLHGHITPEARFIEEGLRTVSLREFLPGEEQRHDLEVHVPSPTNILLLKLFAFNDCDEGKRLDLERAQAHAWDIYVIIMLATSRDDYLEGQDFLSRHEDSDIIKTARSIVSSKFNAVEKAGWRRVLESSDFYPGLNRREKEARLDEARRRLLRWFDISRAGSKPETI
jgi:hypothetical protein